MDPSRVTCFEVHAKSVFASRWRPREPAVEHLFEDMTSLSHARTLLHLFPESSAIFFSPLATPISPKEPDRDLFGAGSSGVLFSAT